MGNLNRVNNKVLYIQNYVFEVIRQKPRKTNTIMQILAETRDMYKKGYKYEDIADEMQDKYAGTDTQSSFTVKDGTPVIITATSYTIKYGDELPAYADVNGDGVVTIKDVTDLIDMLLSGN